jgi:hypothetical protein
VAITSLQLRWADVPAEHRRWLILNAVLITAVINVVLNAGLAWFSLHGADRVPVWDPLPWKISAGLDTITTFFFLPLFTCLFVSTSVWIEMRRGRLRPLTGIAFADRLPAGRIRRGAWLGALCVAVLSPLAVIAFVVAGLDSMSAKQFIVYKAVLCLVFGAIVTPVIAVWAMGSDPPARLVGR